MRELLSLVAPYKRAAIVVFTLATIFYVAFLAGHALTRKPWNDEAMSALAGYNLGFHGHTGVSFYDEAASGYTGVSRHSYYIFPFQLVILAGWYHIVPFELFWTRMLAMLWLLAMLVAFYQVLRKLTLDPAIAFIAAALTAFDYQIMLAGSFGRYDSMVAALGIGAYAMFLLLRERNLGLALLASNAAIAASGATHPNGFFYFLGLWFLILYFDRGRIGFKHLAMAAIPYAIGGVFWAAYIFDDFPSFKGQMTRNSGGRIGLLTPINTLISEIQTRYITAYGLGGHSAGHNSPLVKLKAIGLIAYLIGVIGCLAIPSIRSNRIYRPLFGLAFVHWFMLTFWENYKFSYYLIHLVPFYWALLAIVSVTLWRARPIPRFAIAGALSLVVLIHIGGVAAKIRLNENGRIYVPAVAYVKEHAAPGDLVYASCSFGFGYGFPPELIDDDSFGYSSGRQAAYIVMEEIYEAQHDVYKQIAPEKYAHTQRVLGSYRMVYQNGEYKVYRRPAAGD